MWSGTTARMTGAGTLRVRGCDDACSEWAHSFPDCGYTLRNSPHLKPAYVIDALIRRFSADIGANIHDLGRFKRIDSEAQLSAVIDYFRHAVLPVRRMLLPLNPMCADWPAGRVRPGRHR